MNLATFIVLALVAAALVLALAVNKRRDNSCCKGCHGCDAMRKDGCTPKR